MADATLDPKARDLAEKIFRDLVSNAVQVTQNKVATTTDPANLATLSFKLAYVFRAEEDKLNAANLPKNQDFKVGVDDLAAWTK